MGLRDLVARTVEEVRSSQVVKSRQRILVSEFIEELGSASALEAHARDLKFVVSPVQDDLAIDVDRQILAAVVGNLVQNAPFLGARMSRRFPIPPVKRTRYARQLPSKRWRADGSEKGSELWHLELWCHALYLWSKIIAIAVS